MFMCITQVCSHDILRYGKPPRIVKIFALDSDNTGTTPPNLKMVTFFVGAIKE